MKSLSLTTPRVIFLVGIPGAGKTYFAEKFSEAFGAPFIETDKIRRIITDKPSYSTEEQQYVDELAALQLTELMKTRKTIIFEGGTEARVERTNLAKFVRSFGYEPMIVWVQTDPSTAKTRAIRGVRGHSKLSLISEERFNQLCDRFTMPNSSEQATVISGRHTPAVQTKAILKKLAGEHNNAVQTKNVIPERARRANSNSIKIN